MDVLALRVADSGTRPPQLPRLCSGQNPPLQDMAASKNWQHPSWPISQLINQATTKGKWMGPRWGNVLIWCGRRAGSVTKGQPGVATAHRYLGKVGEKHCRNPT